MSKKNIFSYPRSMNNISYKDEKIKRPNYNLYGQKTKRKENKLLNLPKKNIKRKEK